MPVAVCPMAGETAAKPRRGHGEGSERLRKDGRREVRYVDASGNRRSLCLPRGTSRRDALRALRALLTLTEEGQLVGNDRQRIDLFLERWVAEVAPRHLRPRTVERYAGIVRTHLIPTLGRLRLAQLSPQHIDGLHARCLQKMSPASVRSVHACLRSALRYAVTRRLIERNPADDAPAPRATRPEVQVLDGEQCRQLLDAVTGDDLEPLYVLAITTGARLGELL